MVDLAVAIELVAEEIEEHEEIGFELRQHAHGIELVALKDADAVVRICALERGAGFEHRAGDTRLHVVARAVAHDGCSGQRGERVGDEVCGRGLAVRAGHDHALAHERRERAQKVGLDFERDASGQHAALALEDGTKPPAGEIARGACDAGTDIHGASLSQDGGYAAGAVAG